MIFNHGENLQLCVNCGKQQACVIRQDELFGRGEKAVIIENIPMLKCRNCGLIYLEPAVSRQIDEICAHPERHTRRVEKAVATLA